MQKAVFEKIGNLGYTYSQIMLEAKNLTVGVGALVVIPEYLEAGFVAVEEMQSKRETRKLEGMLSLPMETLEPGESDQQALLRLLTEEVRIVSVKDSIYLGVYAFSENVMLNGYVVTTTPDAVISEGDDNQEVSLVGFIRFEEVLNSPKGSYRFRPGVKEVVSDYLQYLSNPNSFTPRRVLSHQLYEQVPDVIFDWLDNGVSLEEALLLSDCSRRIFVNNRSLAHL